MRRILFTAAFALAALVGSTSSVIAVPSPSATFVMVCSRSVTYGDPFDAPSVQVALFDASGNQVGASPYVACPSGGGRIRTSIPATAQPASATIRCWNGFIQSGSWSGSLALRASCVDTAGAYGTFAKVTVR